MVQFSRRYAERQANMFVVCATTPAQVFHALRRQMNRQAVPELPCASNCHFPPCRLACLCLSLSLPIICRNA